MNRHASLSLVLGIALAGCFGTEGGNPIDPIDGGPGPGDGGIGCDDGGANGSLDPLCERTAELDPACTCAAGDPHAISVLAEGVGQRTTLHGPTASGGFVAVHQRTCTEGCSDTMRSVLEVHRFDAVGARVGDPIEVSRSGSWIDHGVVVDGTSLALAWADERRGPSGQSDIWFARLDLATGAWSVAPHLALTLGTFVFEIRLARAPGGYGLVYSSSSPLDDMEIGPTDVFFARLAGDGVAAAAPTLISDSDLGSEEGQSLSIAPRGDGHVLARWSGSSLLFVTLTADGAQSAPPRSLSSARDARGGEIILRASGTGYVVGWSDGVGVRLARTDATGTAGDVIDLVAGRLRDLVVEDDGTIALLWETTGRQCESAGARTRELVLTRIAPDGTRLHPDVLAHRDSLDLSFGGALVDMADGLRAAYSTYAPAESTAWIVPACAP